MPPKKRFVAIEVDIPLCKGSLSTLEFMHGEADRRFTLDEIKAIAACIDLIEQVLRSDEELTQMEVDLQ